MQNLNPMKKILTLVALLATTASFAQLSQGTIYGTANMGITSTSSETTNAGTKTAESTNTTGNFGFGAGYFIADGLSVGLAVNLNNTTFKDELNGGETSTSTNLFGVGARKYASLSDNFALFGQLGVGFGSGKSETEAGGTTTTTNEFSAFAVQLAPGFTFFPNDRIGLDVTVGSIGYTSTTNKNPAGNNETSNGTFNFGINLAAVTFGVQVFFNSGGGM